MTNTPNPHENENLEIENDTSPIKMPQKPSVASNIKLKKLEKEEYLKKLKKTPLFTQICRYIGLIGFLVTIMWWWWLIMDLDEDNTYLSSYGVQQNRSQKFESYTTQKEQLTQEIETIESEIKTIEEQIKNKEYSIFTEQIRQLESNQKTFFDQADEISPIIQDLKESDPKNVDIVLELSDKDFSENQKTIIQTQIENKAPESDVRKTLQEFGLHDQAYGLLDIPFYVQEYFNDRNFNDDIFLTNANNQINIESVRINNNTLTIDVSGTNIFGSTFYLYTKFIETLNAFPFLANGQLGTYQKEKNNEDYYLMETNIRFDIEQTEVSSEEKPYLDFKNWYENKQETIDQNALINTEDSDSSDILNNNL